MRATAFFALLLSCSVYAQVSAEQCITLENEVGKATLMAMSKDLDIDGNSIIREKTEAKLLSDRPVNELLALTYGKVEKELSGKNSDDPTTAEGYAAGFMEKKGRHLLVKYTFENRSKQRNVLLVSAFINDEDCAVRYNGYLIAAREF